MATIYLTSQSQADLLSLLTVVDGNRVTMPYANTLFGAAVPAVPAGTDAMGNPTAAIPTQGVAGNYYLSVNDPTVTLDANGAPVWPDALPASVAQDAVNGQAVLGVWA